MVDAIEQAHKAAERVARESYGRLLAFLVVRTRDVAGAEDARTPLAFLAGVAAFFNETQHAEELERKLTECLANEGVVVKRAFPVDARAGHGATLAAAEAAASGAAGAVSSDLLHAAARNIETSARSRTLRIAFSLIARGSPWRKNWKRAKDTIGAAQLQARNRHHPQRIILRLVGAVVEEKF